jgi:hypothetical protein
MSTTFAGTWVCDAPAAALLNVPFPDCGNLCSPVQIRFIASLKPPFKFSADYPGVGKGLPMQCAASERTIPRAQGECVMARIEIPDPDMAPLGEAAFIGDTLFDLGMRYSVGDSVPVDLISAHKWFNLAAIKGNADATRLRREIADQMSETEIAAAQRAARDWMRASHTTPGTALAA